MLKKFLKRKKKEEQIIYSNKEGIGIIIHENDHVNIVHDACRICYNKQIENTYEDRLKYIADKVRLGHESILEHSNVVIKLNLNKELYPELSEVLSYCRYLNTKVKVNEKDNSIIVLIGGSIRGYKHIIRNIDSFENKVFNILFELMYELPYCYFEDLIIDEIFDRHRFKNIDRRISVELENEEIVNKKRYIGKTIKREKYDIVALDNLSKLYYEGLTTEEQLLFSIQDILELTSITILFKEVSRIISQQLTRHRAAITQLSQRYVDESESKFLSPDIFKPEEYDKNHKYNIMLTLDKDTQEGVGFFKTLQELGDLMNTVYPQLKSQGLKKEDARAYLLNNTKTSLYMTFSHINFIKFLELRTPKAAQAEVRQLAIPLSEDYKDCMCEFIGDDIYSYLLPKYSRISMELDTLGEEEIDEVIEIVEENVIEEEKKDGDK